MKILPKIEKKKKKDQNSDNRHMWGNKHINGEKMYV